MTHIILYILLTLSYISNPDQMIKEKLDIQGHRGCRGLYPENSIPAFLHAIELGVTTLECDAVISKDHQVILSHEPFMNHEICTKPNGDDIRKRTEKKHNLYQLTYEEIKKYDCGSKYFQKFPLQEKISTHKPSLKDVVEAVSVKLASLNRESICYNLEIKRRPEWDTSHHPEYKVFADLVIRDVSDLGILDNTTIQCFDIPTLQYINSQYPEVNLVFLVDNRKSPQNNLDQLGFIPYVYSPNYKLVNKKLVNFCESKNMQLIPWTVNKSSDIKKMIEMGVDGIISDYPERIIAEVEK